MAATAETALQRLQQAASQGDLVRLCERHSLDLLVVFGSAASEASVATAQDLDLAYRSSDPVDEVTLLQDLYDLTGSEAMDLLDLNRAGVVARAEALGRGRPLFESEPDRFAEEQIVAIAQRADTQWLRDLELAIMAGS